MPVQLQALIPPYCGVEALTATLPFCWNAVLFSESRVCYLKVMRETIMGAPGMGPAACRVGLTVMMSASVSQQVRRWRLGFGRVVRCLVPSVQRRR